MLVPSAPKNVDVTQINSSSIRVSWELPTDKGENEILGYYVYKDLIENDHNTNKNYRKTVTIWDKNVGFCYGSLKSHCVLFRNSTPFSMISNQTPSTRSEYRLLTCEAMANFQRLKRLLQADGRRRRQFLSRLRFWMKIIRLAQRLNGFRQSTPTVCQSGNICYGISRWTRTAMSRPRLAATRRVLF